MPGSLSVSGTATGDGGVNPFRWSNTRLQGLSLLNSEGISVDLPTGVFTVKAGYQGRYYFNWTVTTVTTTGGGPTIQLQLVSDPLGTLGTPVVVFQSERRMGNAGDIGNASLGGSVLAAVGDTFAMRVAGDPGARIKYGTLFAYHYKPH